MRRKNYKGKCEKRRVSKCKDVCRTYNDIQYAYSEMLQHDNQIKEFQCNVLTQTSHTENQPKAHKLGQKQQFNITQPKQYAKNHANKQVNAIQSWRAMN